MMMLLEEEDGTNLMDDHIELYIREGMCGQWLGRDSLNIHTYTRIQDLDAY